MSIQGERPRVGAKAVTWDWDWITSNFDDDVKCYRLTNRQVAFLSTIFMQASWSTRWFNQPANFEDIQQFVIDTNLALMMSQDCEPPTPPPTPTNEQIAQALSNFLDNECEEPDMALQIQTINGVDYLVENCCGGATRYWAMTPAGVGPNGEPVSPSDSGIGSSESGGASGAWDWGDVSDANVPCYGGAATNYLLGRVTEFAHAIIDFATAGISVFTGLDDVLEITRVTNLIVTGDDDIAQIEALTKSAVTQAFSESAIRSALSNNWDYNGRITRNNLQEWIKASPWNSLNGVPVRLILGQWVANSWLWGISTDLSQLAAECESGNQIPTRTYDFTLQSYEPKWQSRPTQPTGQPSVYVPLVGWQQDWDFAAQIWIDQPQNFTSMRIYVGGDPEVYTAQFQWFEYDAAEDEATNPRNLGRIPDTNIWEWTGSEAIIAQILTAVDNSTDDAIIERIDILA